MMIFEQRHGQHVWRLEATVWNGEERLQIWPWYHPKDGGDLRPCSARYGGGFHIPLDRLGELMDALLTIEQTDKPT